MKWCAGLDKWWKDGLGWINVEWMGWVGWMLKGWVGLDKCEEVGGVG